MGGRREVRCSDLHVEPKDFWAFPTLRPSRSGSSTSQPWSLPVPVPSSSVPPPPCLPVWPLGQADQQKNQRALRYHLLLPAPGRWPVITAHFPDEETEADRGRVYSRQGAPPLLPIGSFRERRGVVLSGSPGTPDLAGMQPRDCGLDEDGRRCLRADPNPLSHIYSQLFLSPLSHQAATPSSTYLPHEPVGEGPL